MQRFVVGVLGRLFPRIRARAPQEKQEKQENQGNATAPTLLTRCQECGAALMPSEMARGETVCFDCRCEKAAW